MAASSGTGDAPPPGLGPAALAKNIGVTELSP